MKNVQQAIELILPQLQRYLQESRDGELGAVALPPLRELAERLSVRQWIEQGGMDEEALRCFLQDFLPATTKLHAPGFLAHQTCASSTGGTVGALLDGCINNPMNIYEMGPATAAIEYVLINWLLEQCGWRPAPWPRDRKPDDHSGAGVLTHGGSLGNLTALLAARSHAVPDAWENGVPADLVVLATPQSHYSVARSCGLLGLGRRQIEPLAVDEHGVILPERLPAQLDALREQGKTIMAVVANACSTAAGLFDPLRPIGEICREKGVWLHVDGAHGASFLLHPQLRKRLDGIELADSLIWDAHKMMQTPPLCTAVLVRQARTLDQAFEQEASYLFHEKRQPGFDFMHRTVECTRAGQALKWFFTLAEKGPDALAEDLAYTVDLAHQAWVWFGQQDDFHCPVEPQANILCFEHRGSDPIAVRDALIEEGDFHLSTTIYQGKRWLRLVVMHRNTTLDTIRQLAERIRALGSP